MTSRTAAGKSTPRKHMQGRMPEGQHDTRSLAVSGMSMPVKGDRHAAASGPTDVGPLQEDRKRAQAVARLLRRRTRTHTHAERVKHQSAHRPPGDKLGPTHDTETRSLAASGMSMPVKSDRQAAASGPKDVRPWPKDHKRAQAVARLLRRRRREQRQERRESSARQQSKQSNRRLARSLVANLARPRLYMH